MNYIADIGSLDQYDGTELSLVAEFTLPDGERACEMLSTIDLADVDQSHYPDAIFFYSVYVHLKTGGVTCAGDFDKLEDAQIYCHALDSLLRD